MENIKKVLPILIMITCVSAFTAIVCAEPGFLGVNFTKVTDDIVKSKNLPFDFGILIIDVTAESAADKAGLKKGDVITEVNGEEVNDEEQFADMIYDLEAGTEISLRIYRDGKVLNLKAVLGENREKDSEWLDEESYIINIKPEDDEDRFLISVGPEKIEIPGVPGFPWSGISYMVDINKLSGMVLWEMDSNLASYFSLNDGLLVLTVKEDSEAEKAGIKSGDVVKSVENEQIKNSKDLRKALKKIDKEKTIKIGIKRKDKFLAKEVKYISPLKYYKIIKDEAMKRAREKLEKIKEAEILRKEELEKRVEKFKEKERDFEVKIVRESERAMEKLEEKMKEIEKKLEEMEKKLKEKEKN
jgi:membrane-associated protease RseP (regulator of RpoE activity)